MMRFYRLAMAVMVAAVALAAVAPRAQADPQALVAPGWYVYDYYDDDGPGEFAYKLKSGGTSWGQYIEVAIYQNGYTATGSGVRSYQVNSSGERYFEFKVHVPYGWAYFQGWISHDEGHGWYWDPYDHQWHEWWCWS